MDKLKTWFQGKKFIFGIIVAVVTFVVEKQYGIGIPDDVWVAIAAWLGITYKIGQNRIEQETKNLIGTTQNLIKVIKEDK